MGLDLFPACALRLQPSAQSFPGILCTLLQGLPYTSPSAYTHAHLRVKQRLREIIMRPFGEFVLGDTPSSSEFFWNFQKLLAPPSLISGPCLQGNCPRLSGILSLHLVPKPGCWCTFPVDTRLILFDAFEKG
jgi:hypothetical protein